MDTETEPTRAPMLRCDDPGRDKLVANNRKRRGFCPSYGA